MDNTALGKQRGRKPPSRPDIVSDRWLGWSRVLYYILRLPTVLAYAQAARAKRPGRARCSLLGLPKSVNLNDILIYTFRSTGQRT